MKVLLAVPLVLLSAVGAGARERRTSETAPQVAIPPRAPSAPGGTAFVASLAALPRDRREQAIFKELSRGNVPDFLRSLRPIRLSLPGQPAADGRQRMVTATVWVMPDYLAVGSNEDFVRVPLGLPTATAIARRFGFVLPTRKLVDAIYQQAALRLPPVPMPAGPEMRSVHYLLRHNRTIEQQRMGWHVDGIVAGHKKDLVLSERLMERPERVAIYGWHRPDGRPIQPLSIVHGAHYADYSHGVRLVAETVLVNGVPRSIYEVLEQPRLVRLLSDEGEIADARRLMGLESPAPELTANAGARR